MKQTGTWPVGGSVRKMLFLGNSSPVLYSSFFPSVQRNLTQFQRHQLYTLICLEKASFLWAVRSFWRLGFLIADTLQKLCGGSHVISPYCYFREIIQSEKACLLMKYHKALPIPLSDWLVWQIDPKILNLDDLKSGHEHCAFVCGVTWHPLDSRGWMRRSSFNRSEY